MTNKTLAAIGLYCIASTSAYAQDNPRLSWQDSYAVDGVCYCNSNFDHGIANTRVSTPIGQRTVRQVCDDITDALGTGRNSGRIPYNDVQCGNGPANNAGDEDQNRCPGRVDIGSRGCDDIGPGWDLDAVYRNTSTSPNPEPTPTPVNDNGTSDTLVQIRKRNASRFAVASSSGGSNRQNVFLSASNAGDRNQQWVEIDRGDGFYSYRKNGTNHCIDGNNGGANRQNVHLWTCSAGNLNQSWRKVPAGGGTFRLIKRNAQGFTLDGGGGASQGLAH